MKRDNWQRHQEIGDAAQSELKDVGGIVTLELLSDTEYEVALKSMCKNVRALTNCGRSAAKSNILRVIGIERGEILENNGPRTGQICIKISVETAGLIKTIKGKTGESSGTLLEKKVMERAGELGLGRLR